MGGWRVYSSMAFVARLALPGGDSGTHFALFRVNRSILSQSGHLMKNRTSTGILCRLMSMLLFLTAGQAFSQNSIRLVESGRRSKAS